MEDTNYTRESLEDEYLAGNDGADTQEDDDDDGASFDRDDSESAYDEDGERKSEEEEDEDGEEDDDDDDEEEEGTGEQEEQDENQISAAEEEARQKAELKAKKNEPVTFEWLQKSWDDAKKNPETMPMIKTMSIAINASINSAISAGTIGIGSWWLYKLIQLISVPVAKILGDASRNLQQDPIGFALLALNTYNTILFGVPAKILNLVLSTDPFKTILKEIKEKLDIALVKGSAINKKKTAGKSSSSPGGGMYKKNQDKMKQNTDKRVAKAGNKAANKANKSAGGKGGAAKNKKPSTGGSSGTFKKATEAVKKKK
ncbi:MAG: hypothetical protein FWD32_00110 [Firmicutes bacterium]|nr:hypothetical protein [Bacillota bacterium]